LAPFHAEVGQQNLFHLSGMLSGFPQPAQNGLFFMPFHPAQAANAVAFGQKGQDFQNLLLRGAFAVEHRPHRGREGPMASFALIALNTFARLAVSLDVLLLCPLWLAVIRASGIRAEISCSGKLFHHSYPDSLP